MQTICRFNSFAKLAQQARNASSVKILKNTYKDSIELMQLSNKLKSRKGVQDAAVMLGTEANVELMKNAGLLGNEVATTSDIIVSCVAEDDATVADTLKFAVDSLTAVADSFGQSGAGGVPAMKPKTIEEGTQSMKDANFIIISSPGNYATAETMKALKKGLHVFLFSDNVSIEDELMLKQQAAKKKLFLMGPDCGTSILDGIPFGFANAVRRGSIGMIASSGTGAQQVSCLVDKFGLGVSQLIGTGGRDLKEKVGGIMTLLSIDVLEADPKTQVITIISKGQPGPSSMKALCARIKTCKKPVVVVLLGADGTELTKAGAHVAFTLEDAARLSVQVQEGTTPSIATDPNSLPRERTDAYGLKPQQTKVVGLFAGGTHCAETAMILKKMQADHKEFGNFQMDIIDLGDDEYCVGKPHPMIDGTTRKSVFIKRAAEPETAVIIFDVVLGFGSHDNPAADICEAIATCRKNNPNVIFVGHVCGVEGDFQNLQKSEQILRENGVILLPTNAQASRVAGQIAARMNPRLPASADASYSSIFGSVNALNLGLAHFTTGVTKYGGKAIQLDWKPPAKGNRDAGLNLARLFGDASDSANLGNLVDKANQEAVNRLKAGQPMLIDVKLASEVIPGFTGKKICHAGPPITWDRMCGPMRGAIIGAIVYEGWAKDIGSAEIMAGSGQIEFAPCHHYNAVGPMAGILSPSFPVAIVENGNGGNRAYASMNEGLGKVLRMGANNDAVIEKLRWIKNVLAPTLSEGLRVNGPIDLRAITQQALMMGDECHNRNAAATSIFTRAIAPALLNSKNAKETLDFLKSNDHFYLNLSMAASKAVLDSAKGIKGSTICVAMCRNGVDFGVRLSGTGDRWFTAPAAMIKGLYFPGYTEADANPDIGDSSITETIGIGGFAMACAPAIVKFVGGNAQDAIANTREMYRITQTKNAMNTIPILDFEGTPLGIDARKVADSLIQPVINTGIAHKVAGVGQVGAGIALAPLEPFIEGINAVYADLAGPNKSRE